MSDVTPMCKGCEKLFALLTAERAEHAGHIVDLEQHIKALDIRWDKREYAKEVADLKKELTRVSCMHSDAHAKVINLEKQVDDLQRTIDFLRQRIHELDAEHAEQISDLAEGNLRVQHVAAVENSRLRQEVASLQEQNNFLVLELEIISELKQQIEVKVKQLP
jgi:chromosome segregation ATPase